MRQGLLRRQGRRLSDTQRAALYKLNLERHRGQEFEDQLKLKGSTLPRRGARLYLLELQLRQYEVVAASCSANWPKQKL